MKFVGWKSCGTEPADVELAPISSDVTPTNCLRGQSCTDSFGSRNRGKGVHINVLFGDEALSLSRYKRAMGGAYDPNAIPPMYLMVPKLCSDEAWGLVNNPTQANEDKFVAEWKRCLQLNALHEFGHLAGFAHEWYRTDDKAKQKACMADLGITDLPTSAAEGAPDTPLGPFDSESIMSYCRHEKRATLTGEDIEQTNDVYRRLAPKLASKSAVPEAGAPLTRSSGDSLESDDDSQEASDDSQEPTRKPKRRTTPTVSNSGCNG
jgi:hypothetical protein